MKLTLPYPPTANHLKRIVVIGHHGKLVNTAEAKEYRARVQNRCIVNRVVPLEGPVAITMRAYRPRRVGDLDNNWKALLDALKGYAYRDDKQVVEQHGYLFDDKQDPRLEVEIVERAWA